MPQNSWTAKALGVKEPVDPQHIPDDAEVVVLVQAENMFGDPIYCYLKLQFEHYDTVKSKLEAGEKFDLREYGDIIAAGRGEPTDEVRQEISEEYNMVQVAIQEPEPIPESFDYEEVDEDNFPF